MFAYVIEIEFDDAGFADEFIGWLTREHIADVCHSGAVDAELIRLDNDLDNHDAARANSVRCIIRYRFASRAAFEVYERDHAPRLRSDGLAQIPKERRVQFRRATGEIMYAYSSTVFALPT